MYLLTCLVTFLVFCPVASGQTTTTVNPQNTTTQISTTQVTQAVKQNDVCLDTAWKNVQVSLNRRFPEFVNLTSTLWSARELYRNIFSQRFSNTTFGAYCEVYKTGRADMDKCNGSEIKMAMVNELALADYVCAKRLQDYSEAIACFQKIDNAVENTLCKTNCSAYETQSSNYKVPPQNSTKETMTTYMIGDCLYTKCMAECRQPIIEKQCDPEDARLEKDALKITMASVQASFEHAELMTNLANKIIGQYPKECKDAYDALGPSMIADQGLIEHHGEHNGTASPLSATQNHNEAAAHWRGTKMHIFSAAVVAVVCFLIF